MTSQIQNTIHTLFQPGAVLELRALWKNGGVASGYYTDYSFQQSTVLSIKNNA